jgi:alpha-aminoadipate carrier protein LysW
MSTTTAACNCPECDAGVSFQRTPVRGEVVRCPDCSAELEVTAIAPVTLELAPEVEEDWGE